MKINTCDDVSFAVWFDSFGQEGIDENTAREIFNAMDVKDRRCTSEQAEKYRCCKQTN